MTGSNDPCPCGSGKKFKRCCAHKPVDLGPCSNCDVAAVGANVCKLCDKRYSYCRAHQTESTVMTHGHVLRVHPESIPELIDILMKNKNAMAQLRAAAELDPESFEKLFEHIANRQN